MSLRMPEPDAAILGRLERIVAALRTIVPGEGVFLLSPAQQILLRGRLYELVAPYLDGSTADDLCERLQGRASAAC